MDLSLEPQNPSTLYGQDYVEKMDVEENQWILMAGYSFGGKIIDFM